MLYVPAYTYERRPDPATLYPTSFTLDFLLALTIFAQRISHGLFSHLALWLVGYFSCYCMIWDERGGGLTGQPVGPLLVNTTTIATVTSTNRVDLGSFCSRCCTFWRTYTSADPIGQLCIRLALPLTLSLPPQFAPSARPMVCVSPRALWLARAFMCDCTFWDER